MGNDRRVRPAAIVLAGTVLAVGIGTIVHVASSNTRRPPVEDGTWIGLPTTGMDAGGHAVRQLLLRTDPATSLAFECGNPFLQRGASDRYVAHIGKGAFGPPAWKVAMEVRGDDIEIRWSEDGLTLPPPPPPPVVPSDVSGPARADFKLVAPTTITLKTRTELDQVRARWLDSSLWDAPQDSISLNCLDGNPVFLEACVGGRYAARMRNCGDSMQATSLLWEAFNDVLPAPSRSYWRDASGRRVDLD